MAQLTRPQPGPLRGPGWGLATVANRCLEAIKNDYHLENFTLHPLAFLISGGGTHVVGKLQLVRVYRWACLGVLLGLPGCSRGHPESIHFLSQNTRF